MCIYYITSMDYKYKILNRKDTFDKLSHYFRRLGINDIKTEIVTSFITFINFCLH